MILIITLVGRDRQVPALSHYTCHLLEGRQIGPKMRMESAWNPDILLFSEIVFAECPKMETVAFGSGMDYFGVTHGRFFSREVRRA